MQAVEHIQEGLAGHLEDAVDAVGLERSHDGMAGTGWSSALLNRRQALNIPAASAAATPGASVIAA